MRVLITRYPASEDRLIVRPLLCRRCALRLQPAEPQPYSRYMETLRQALPRDLLGLLDWQLPLEGELAGQARGKL